MSHIICKVGIYASAAMISILLASLFLMYVLGFTYEESTAYINIMSYGFITFAFSGYIAERVIKKLDKKLEG